MANKLVRDKIPELISIAGEQAEFKIISSDELPAWLRDKLQEEVDEYQRSLDPEELADILEVLLALAETHGLTKNQFEMIAERKRDAKGAFDRRFALIQNGV